MTVFNPDAGRENGSGIDTVIFRLGYPEGEDPFGEGTTFIPLTQEIFTSPPYRLTLNTEDLPDEAYKLQVGALSSEGTFNRATLNHIIDNTGPSMTTFSISQPQTEALARLRQNYPNPFSNHTTIGYSIRQLENIELWISNSKGERVKTLVLGKHTPGNYIIQWDGTNGAGQKIRSGLYFCVLNIGDQTLTKSLVCIN